MWIVFNFVLLYIFAVHAPFSFTDFRVSALVISLAMSVPFAGIFVLLKEPFPPYSGFIHAFFDALFVSIAEEVSFRGIVGGIAERAYNARFAAIFQAVFFTFFHFKFSAGFLIMYMIFGLACWWVYTWKNKNLLYPILLHLATNFWMYFLYTF